MQLRVSVYTSCLINNCHYPYRRGRKYCSTHNMRLLRYGDPNYLKQARPGGRKKHPLYPSYLNMKDRCYREKNTYYKDYGGRGIKVCDRWLGIDGFDNFIADMGARPSNSTIERIDNDGSYAPDNCRWATRLEQSNNRRSNRLYKINGETKNLKQWADEFGLSHKIVHQRILRDGWSIEKALELAIEA